MRLPFKWLSMISLSERTFIAALCDSNVGGDIGWINGW
jgi:hypothetical protein